MLCLLRKYLALTIILFGTLYSHAQPVSVNEYITIAKENSPLLREFRNAVRSNLIDSQLIRASYLPQVTATTNNLYAPTLPHFGYDDAITNGGAYSTLLGVTKAFASRDNLNTQYQAVRLSSDSTLNESRVSEQDLTRTVLAQYLTAYGDQQQLFADEEISRLLHNEETLLRNLAQNNIYRQTDYLTFLVTLKQQELQLKQARIQYLTDFGTLNYLCGIIDTAAMEKSLTLPALDVQLYADKESSVFFRRYRIDSMRLATQIKLINIAYRPKLSLFADAGYNTSQLNYFYRNTGVSAGFSIALPVYDGGRRKLSIRQVLLQEDARIGYRDFFAKQFNQQLMQLQQQLNATESLMQDINEQITYSKGLIDVNEKLLQTGDARISDFVIAINNYLTARTLLTQNRVSRLQIITQINYWNR